MADKDDQINNISRSIYIFCRVMAGLGELARAPLHTCELCGQEGLTEPDMRSHMMIQHIQSSPSCPFCDLGKTGAKSVLSFPQF